MISIHEHDSWTPAGQIALAVGDVVKIDGGLFIADMVSDSRCRCIPA